MKLRIDPLTGMPVVVNEEVRVYSQSGGGHGSGGGGSGTVTSVTAGDSTITVAGTSTDPTVAVNAIPESKVTNLVSDLALKAPLASPALTGTPTAPTASAGTNSTQVATTAYADSAIATALTGVLNFKGSTDASVNPNYPSAVKGDAYVVSVAGKIGGASGVSVDVGDVYFATANNVGGTQASVGTSWDILEHNLVGALLSANNLSDLANAGTARTNLGLGTSATQNKVAAGNAGVLDATDPTTTNSRAPNGGASGDLTGTYPSPTLASIVTGATVGDATHIPIITYDAKGRITGTTTATISASAPTQRTFSYFAS